MPRQIFRPPTQNWISPIVSLVFLLAIGLFFVQIQKDIPLYCLSPFVILTLFSLLAIWKSQIKLTDEYLLANIGLRRQIRIPWQNILMVRRVQQEKDLNYLEIATQEEAVRVDLRTFDAEAIWQEVQRLVPPQALDEEAYKNTPAYQNWVKEREYLVTQVDKPYKGGYNLSAKILMFVIWFTVVTIGFAFLVGLEIKLVSAWLFYGILVVGAGLVFGVSLRTRVEMTSEKIKTFGALGYKEKEIEWAQVEKIENRRGYLIFFGQDKKLGVLSPQLWYGKDREKMVKMMYAQIEHRNINMVGKNAG